MVQRKVPVGNPRLWFVQSEARWRTTNLDGQKMMWSWITGEHACDEMYLSSFSFLSVLPKRVVNLRWYVGIGMYE